MRFSANLGFLWTDRPLPEAIRTAKAAGFDAVEVHFPYAENRAAVSAALEETGLALLGLNTRRGDRPGDNGLAALPGRAEAAKAAIAEAMDWAAALGARNVHVMAGAAEGTAAHGVYLDNLAFACELAAERGVSVLIEPLNARDAPGYFLRTTDQATAIMAELGRPELRLMYDCYHVQIMEGDLLRRFEALMDRVGHVQFAGAPERGRPDRGEVAYDRLLPAMAALGWDQPFGAEYRPEGGTEASLGWLERWREL